MNWDVKKGERVGLVGDITTLLLLDVTFMACAGYKHSV